MKRIFALLLTILCLTACGKEAEAFIEITEQAETQAEISVVSESEMFSETPEIAESEAISVPSETTNINEGKIQSLLTGEYIPIEAAARRPVAYVVNNIKKALPQSGISKADIVYEVITEGDITRMVAVFQSDFSSEKIGPIRSARHYFLRIAMDSNAVFAHHGRSEYADKDLKSLKYNNLDGMELEGSMFWRDPVRVKQSGMYEHSSYTNGEKTLNAITKKSYNEVMPDNAVSMFDFYDEFTVPESGKSVDEVVVPFSKAYTSTFTYNKDDKLYYKLHSGNPHLDEETGEQLKFANVIIQFTSISLIKNDKYGCRNVELVGSGTGFYISGGKYIPIRWEKTSFDSTTQFYCDNKKLEINQGKTFICINSTGTEIGFK